MDPKQVLATDAAIERDFEVMAADIEIGKKMSEAVDEVVSDPALRDRLKRELKAPPPPKPHTKRITVAPRQPLAPMDLSRFLIK